jgi:hypothetical protein
LRRQVAADPNPEVLHISTDYLDDELGEYAGRTSEFYQSREVEVRVIIRLMAKASEVEVDELPEIRRRLSCEVERLRAGSGHVPYHDPKAIPVAGETIRTTSEAGPRDRLARFADRRRQPSPG